jgi:hypothetical protein
MSMSDVTPPPAWNCRSASGLCRTMEDNANRAFVLDPRKQHPVDTGGCFGAPWGIMANSVFVLDPCALTPPPLHTLTHTRIHTRAGPTQPPPQRGMGDIENLGRKLVHSHR